MARPWRGHGGGATPRGQATVVCRVERGASGPLQTKKIGPGDLWLSTDGSLMTVCSSDSKDRGRKGGVVDGLPVGVGDDGFGAVTRRGSDESAPCCAVLGRRRSHSGAGSTAASSSSCSAPSSCVVAAPSSDSGGLVAGGILLLLASSHSSFFPASSPSFPLLFSFLALLCFLDAAGCGVGEGGPRF